MKEIELKKYLIEAKEKLAKELGCKIEDLDQYLLNENIETTSSSSELKNTCNRCGKIWYLGADELEQLEGQLTRSATYVKQVGSINILFEAKKRLEEGGHDVLGPVDHTIIQSIYFFDPNGHRIELTVNTTTPEMERKLDAVKWDMLNEWSITRKAPNHAQWMHDGSTHQEVK